MLFFLNSYLDDQMWIVLYQVAMVRLTQIIFAYSELQLFTYKDHRSLRPMQYICLVHSSMNLDMTQSISEEYPSIILYMWKMQ